MTLTFPVAVLLAVQEYQPDNVVLCCPNQIAQMIEPALYSKHRSPVELLSTTVRLLFRCAVALLHTLL